MSTEDDRNDPWMVCLCAAWCRTCDDYAETLRRVAAEFAPIALRWIDIEDEAELIGDVDVETFPTVLIGHADTLWFAGPLLPQPEVLRRLLANLLRVRAPATAEVDPAMRALARRVAAQFAEAAPSRKPPTT